jgi:hypothetical protein
MNPVPKPVDFSQSARRHFDDAKLLEANGRRPNAAHLYGFVAECGLKALLCWHGYPTDPEGSPIRKSEYRVHVDQLVVARTLTSLKLFVSGRSGAKYLAVIPNIDAFADWKADHRYVKDSALPTSLLKWKTAAFEVGRMLDLARMDGKR